MRSVYREIRSCSITARTEARTELVIPGGFGFCDGNELVSLKYANRYGLFLDEEHM
jgi:hypothetical protein